MQIGCLSVPYSTKRPRQEPNHLLHWSSWELLLATTSDSEGSHGVMLSFKNLLLFADRISLHLKASTLVLNPHKTAKTYILDREKCNTELLLY